MVSPEKDAEALYEAMDKLNTDEEAIIKIISAGAPVLAESLVNDFVRLVESEQTLRLRNEELEKMFTEEVN